MFTSEKMAVRRKQLALNYGLKTTDIHRFFDLYNGNIKAGDSMQFCFKDRAPEYYKVVIDFEFDFEVDA